MDVRKIPKRPTRSNTDHWLFGRPLNGFDSKVLPTKLDVIKNYYFTRNFLLYLRESRQLRTDDKDMIYKACVVAHVQLIIFQKCKQTAVIFSK